MYTHHVATLLLNVVNTRGRLTLRLTNEEKGQTTKNGEKARDFGERNNPWDP